MNNEEAIENLKKYINEDFAYREPIKNMSDFDKFCYNHCKDIDTVLNYIEKLENMYNKEHNEHIEMKRQNSVLRNNERILKEKIEELEKKSKKCEYFEEVADVLYKDNINKQKLRDKIEQIENRNYNDFTREQDGNEVKYSILKEFEELLESEN